MEILYPFERRWPVTQRFGENPADYPRTNGHAGIDFGVPIGTPILAGITGIITFAGEDNTGYGNLVVIKDETSTTTIYYGHQSKIDAVKGSRILKGDILGYSGNTGNSTGPHLHLEYRPDGRKAVDPEPLIVFEATEEKPAFVGGKIDAIKAMVTGDMLRLRDNPNLATSRVLGFLSQGTVIEVLEERVVGKDLFVRVGYNQWLCKRLKDQEYITYG
jgi:hypothetical protein